MPKLSTMPRSKWDLISGGAIYTSAKAAIAAGTKVATEMGKPQYLERIEDDRGVTKGWYRLTDIKPDDEISSPFLPNGRPK